MAITNHERVGKAMELLKSGLGPVSVNATRARTLDWAMTQNNLGTALQSLGERESGTGKLEEAVAAYCEALKEFTPEAAPHWHDIAQKNLDRANALLAKRRSTAFTHP